MFEFCHVIIQIHRQNISAMHYMEITSSKNIITINLIVPVVSFTFENTDTSFYDETKKNKTI